MADSTLESLKRFAKELPNRVVVVKDRSQSTKDARRCKAGSASCALRSEAKSLISSLAVASSSDSSIFGKVRRGLLRTCFDILKAQVQVEEVLAEAFSEEAQEFWLRDSNLHGGGAVFVCMKQPLYLGPLLRHEPMVDVD